MKVGIVVFCLLLTTFLIALKSCQTPNHSTGLENIMEENRFTKITLLEGLEEPYELAISKNNLVFFIQRHGKIQLYNPENGKIKDVGTIPVHTIFEDGLVGITLHPNFTENKIVYMFYSPLGGQPEYRVSQFVFDGDSILRKSEKILLRIPSQREDCCHTGGSLAFDNNGNLFISVGDNTTPFKSNGYAPLDERPGSVSRDDQRTAANSNDLRGKILRITPQIEGGYTIPEGNLFPKDGSMGKPEIFVMGNRNPFRISIDQKTNWLYWGEIGPDAGEDSERGPRGHDEINQAKKAGNYGWPYFIADNKPYAMYDFVNDKSGAKQDPAKPINNSINNTGTKQLPPAQKAFIYYPYAASKEFPIVGEGGRSAMAGPVYHYDLYPETPVKFPKAMDNVFFAYEWMRDWVLSVKTKENGELDTIVNNFKHLWFAHPMDIEFAPDGSMYVLEYGYKWWSQDKTTKLSRIIYERGNRMPVAKMTVSDTVGPNQTKVYFSSKGSFDIDGDSLIYEWRFTGNEVLSREKNPIYTYITPGVYYPSLTVLDKRGKSATISKRITVGNHLPEINILFEQNKSFYWENMPLNYTVTGFDREEGKIKNSQIALSLKYVSEGLDIPPVLGHQTQTEDNNKITSPLINASDCKACHQLKDKSVGPSFYDVAIRYKTDANAVEKLATKIIKGGGGSWGDHAMSAHPQISKADATQMVKYILGVIGDKKPDEILQSVGSLKFNKHQEGESGIYYFTAGYQDKGIGNLWGYETQKIRNPALNPDEADEKMDMRDWGMKGISQAMKNNAYFVYKSIDLRDISAITLQYSANVESGTVEIKLDGLKGKTIGKIPLMKTKSTEDWQLFTVQLSQFISEVHDIYFVFKYQGKEVGNMLVNKKVYFQHKNQSKQISINNK
jgi:cytochrome c